MTKIWLGVLLLAPLIWCLNLDSLYQQAQPGEGYDKLLTLDSFQIYEGGFTAVEGKKTGIKGFGAIIDLSLGAIHQINAKGIGTFLDITRCVIINGGDGLAALDYYNNASGKLDHLTMVGGYNGVRFSYGESLILKNSIVVNNSNYGVMTNDSCLTRFLIFYNDNWNNQRGNYMCWFGSC